MRLGGSPDGGLRPRQPHIRAVLGNTSQSIASPATGNTRSPPSCYPRGPDPNACCVANRRAHTTGLPSWDRDTRRSAMQSHGTQRSVQKRASDCARHGQAPAANRRRHCAARFSDCAEQGGPPISALTHNVAPTTTRGSAGPRRLHATAPRRAQRRDCQQLESSLDS